MSRSLLFSWLLLAAPLWATAHARVLRLVGLETRDARELASLGAGASVDAATVRAGSGQRSLRQATASSALVSGLAPALGELGLRFSYRTASNPVAAQDVVVFKSGAGTSWALQLRPDGRLQLAETQALGFVQSVGTVALASSTWHTVTLAYGAGAGGPLTLRVDGATDLSTTHANAGNQVDTIELVGSAVGEYFDDLRLEDTASLPPFGQVLPLRVTGVGGHSELDTVTGGAGRELTVDEGLPSDLDFNRHQAATPASDTYALGDPPAGRVLAVKGVWRMRRANGGGGSGTQDVAWRVDGVLGSDPFVGLSTSFTDTERIWETLPGQASPWTFAQVVGLELGARHNGTLGDDTFVSWVAAMVDLDATQSPPAQPSCASLPAAAWFDPAWALRRPLVTNGTQVTGDLVDFPLLVHVSDASLSATARSNGFDFVFTDDDGTTKLAHDIELFDGVSELWVWVKVPLLRAGTNKTLFLYHQNPTSADQRQTQSTWSNGFRAVWHLSDSGGASATLRSSAQAAFDATPTALLVEPSAKIAAARRWQASGSSMQPASDSALFNGWPRFALEFWLFPDYASDGQLAAAGEPKFLSAGGPLSLGRIRRDGFEPPGICALQIDVRFAAAGIFYEIVFPRRAAWSHVVYERDGEDFKTYVDGVEEARYTVSADRLVNASYLWFGDTFNGPLDEIRISDVGRSNAWVQASFLSQNAPGSFSTQCAPQSSGTTDAGATDAGATDAGVTDAGTADAGTADAGVTDAGATDAGATDAGATDAGATDAGTADAGTADAGTADAGSADAGSADAGSTDDGGASAPVDGGEGHPSLVKHLWVGCGGSSSGGWPAGWLGSAILAAWLVWSARARESHPSRKPGAKSKRAVHR